MGKQLNVIRNSRKDIARWLNDEAQPWIYSAKIKLLTSCNLDCSFCRWRVSNNQARKILTLRDLEVPLQELQAFKVTRIHFSGGEPLIHPEVVDILQYCSGIGIPETAMTTNATLATKEKAFNLFRAGLKHVNVSLDGEVEGFHGKFSRAVSGLNNLVEVRNSLFRKHRISIRMNIVVGSNNVRALPGLIKMAFDTGVDGVNLLPIKNQVEMLLNEEQIEWLRKNVLPLVAKYFGDSYQDLYQDGGAVSGEYTRDYYSRNRCFIPYIHTFISADGSVHICCDRQMEQYPLGNIYEQSIGEILVGEKYKSERARKDRYGCNICGMFPKLNSTIDKALSERRFW